MNRPPPPPTPTRPAGPLWTVELRWFVDGALPDHVGRWFVTALPGAVRQQSRTDTYAHVDSDALSVKLRAGLLEAKGRLERREPVAVMAGLVGHPERWVKWSVPGPSGPVGTPRDGFWVHQVTKRRAWADLTAGAVGTCACFAELTELSLREGAAWTLAAESAGAGATAEELTAALARAFVEPPPVALGADRSMGYPAWLRTRRPADGSADDRDR